MPNVVSAIDGTSPEIQIPFNEPQQKTYFQQYFSYIMETRCSGGGSRGTLREPLTMGKQLVNFLTCGCESSAPNTKNQSIMFIIKQCYQSY
jgi:hypothetical protein